MKNKENKSKWSINPDRVNCPDCGEPMPRVRRPRTMKQALWGGWTCPKCGCDMDKWGEKTGPSKRIDP
jgi:ssDNA-binding Zn-finger/Zn-ribbon topoisomerase 1